MTNEEAAKKVLAIWGIDGFCSFDSSSLVEDNDGMGPYYVCGDNGNDDDDIQEGTGSSWENAFKNLYEDHPKTKRV